jgi:tetrahydromethanopterin S-methyltransferase subunit H
MEIINTREKIIFTEEEAKAIVLVHRIMRDIEGYAEDNDIVNSASDVVASLVDFIEDNFENADCVVRQAVADSTREIQISIAIK